MTTAQPLLKYGRLKKKTNRVTLRSRYPFMLFSVKILYSPSISRPEVQVTMLTSKMSRNMAIISSVDGISFSDYSRDWTSFKPTVHLTVRCIRLTLATLKTPDWLIDKCFNVAAVEGCSVGQLLKRRWQTVPRSWRTVRNRSSLSWTHQRAVADVLPTDGITTKYCINRPDNPQRWVAAD